MNKLNSQKKEQNFLLISQNNSEIENENQIQKTKTVTVRTPIFFNTCFDKGQVKELVSWFLNEYGEKPTINFLESLKSIGFQQATKAGISLGIEDLEIPPDKPLLITEAHISTHKIEQQSAAGSLTSVEKSQCLIDTWNQTSDTLRQNAIQNFRNRNVVNPVYMMAFSGARGNVSQVRQLVAMRGLMADPQGAILEFPIQSNFREGLTITEYLISCYGARKGLVDTALRTATSGYLTRRLVDSAQHAVISMIDCGTTRGNLLQGKNLENRLIGRVLGDTLINDSHKTFCRNHIISPADAKIISKNYNQILVRSPLTCDATTSVCQFCYGWNLASGKVVQIGEAVGVIAAQSIGEPGTQLTMRTFHTGGVGVFSDQALKPILAAYKGKIIFHDSIPGHFIRTPHGKIVYMIKYIPTNPDKILFKLQALVPNHRDLIIREQDLPPGSLLLVKHGEVIEPKKLIAQASHVKLTKQRLPESSNPVYSPLEGQVFFESMNLLVEKEVSSDSDTSKKKLELEKRFSTAESSGLPDVRRMAKIGSFWVFSAYNQHEIHTLNQFVEAGDLVSTNTVLFNYKFHTSSRVQIQKINSQLTFGIQSIQIPIDKITYHKNSYKFDLNNSNNGVFVYYKKDYQNGLLFWYPILDPDAFAISSPKQRSYLPSLMPRRHALAVTLPEFDKINKVDVLNYNHLSQLYIDNFFKTHSETKSLELHIPKGQVFRISVPLPKANKIELSQIKLTRKFYSNFILNNGNQSKPSQLVITQTSSDFLVKKIKTLNNKLIRDSNQFLRSDDFDLVAIRQMGWVFVVNDNKISSFNSVTQRQFLATGLCFHKISFPKQNISIKNLKKINLSTLKTIVNAEDNKNSLLTNVLEQPTIPDLRNWYKLKNFVKTHENFLENYESSTIPITKLNIKYRAGLIWYCYKNNKNNVLLQKPLGFRRFNLKLSRSNNKYSSFARLFLAQSVSEYSFPTRRNIKNRLSQFSGKLSIKNPQNFLFSKQKQTLEQLIPKTKIHFQVQTPLYSGWFSSKNLLRIQYSITGTKANSNFTNISFGYQTLGNTLSRGLSIYQYQYAIFNDIQKFSFKTYLNKWTLPFHSFSSGIVKLKSHGEFRYKIQKTTGTFISILRNIDVVTLLNKNTNYEHRSYIGHTVRWGEKLQAGNVSNYNGQILKKNQTSITLRLGTPILASAHGIIHVFQDDLVLKNQLLITLKSRRLQTEDIVQGIPKIEQLFEARESQGGEVLFDTVHIRLRNAFIRELEFLQEEHWSSAVEKSVLEAQQFLVENIVEAYANQGVKISEKHVEVIVRQMTSRVRILESGETGLLPGELVQHSWIKQFNKHIRDIGLREATYEPLVLGISKSVLQSESFLLAASFQEVSRVLVRSALSKKRDFLRGLHENVIVGQLIPAGTGLINQFKNTQLTSISKTKFSE